MESDEESLTDEDAPAPAQEIMAAGRRVLDAGIWLIRNGYGRMMLLPYAAPSGCYWRCEFHPPGRPGKSFFRYSTGSGAKYLMDHCGGSVRKGISGKRLAEAIMKSVPDDAKAACVGDAPPETLRWLVELERVLAQGYLPQAFHEYSADYSRWDLISTERSNGRPMEPQPGYVRPGHEMTVLDEPYWQQAALRWEEICQKEAVELPTALLNDDDACFDFAHRLRTALNDVDPLQAPRVLRVAIAMLADSRTSVRH